MKGGRATAVLSTFSPGRYHSVTGVSHIQVLIGSDTGVTEHRVGYLDDTLALSITPVCQQVEVNTTANDFLQLNAH